MTDQQGMVMGYPIDVAPPRAKSNRPPINTTATATRHSSTAESQRTTTVSNEDRCKGCLTLVTLVGLLLAVGNVIFLFYQLIAFSALKFKVDSVTVYPLNINASRITANWDITFSVRNPNYGSAFRCEDVKASVFYKETNISSAMMDDFALKTRSKKGHKISVKADVGVTSVHVNSSVAEAIAADLSRGFVTFTVTLNATARSDPGKENELKGPMSVSCEKVKVGFLPNLIVGTMLDGSRKCNVKWFDY